MEQVIGGRKGDPALILGFGLKNPLSSREKPVVSFHQGPNLFCFLRVHT